MNQIVNTKCCTSCKQIKQLSDFYRNKNAFDGYTSACKHCRSKYDNNRNFQINPKIVIKQCNHCKKFKPVDNFIHNRLNQDGLTTKCKICINNIDKSTKRTIKYITNRRKKDPAYKLLNNIRNRMNIAIKRNTKMGSTIGLLGCSIKEFKLYFENLFTKGMSWDNHGLGENCWHIDHIIPCSIFDLNDPIEQKQCFHYTNLQPLWQNDNLSKSNKII